MATGSSNSEVARGIPGDNRLLDLQSDRAHALPNRERVRALAREAGFTEAGVVCLPYPGTDQDAGRFTEFIEAGRAGSMAYLERQNETGVLVRSRVDVPFPWAKSVVVCAAGYNADAPLSINPAPEDTGWIARYAWTGRKDVSGGLRPSDYHKVLLRRLHNLEVSLRAIYGEFEAKAYVDTGPVVERSIARAAGLGWTGKNTCLIHPKLGSWNFLAVLVTSLEILDRESRWAIPDRCGTCRRCIEACPTEALYEPYRMDARRCISYLTIEHRGEIPEELMTGIGKQIFGCDICQDVCPWNRKAPIVVDDEMTPRPELIHPSLERLSALERAEFEQMFNGSPVRRTGYTSFRRNLAVAMGNSGLSRFVPILERWARESMFDPTMTENRTGTDAPDAARAKEREALKGFRSAVRWALHRLATSCTESEVV